MPDRLFIGDRSYSSWSMRAGLLVERAGLPVDLVEVDFSARDVGRQMSAFAPARTVPTLIREDGAVLWDSLAIAEDLAERYPEAGLWPADPMMRALARSLAAEMHAGFGALREHCPMNLRTAYVRCDPPAAVRMDVARIEAIWAHAEAAAPGPWLCGDWSIADSFFAPVAARIAGYGLPVGAAAAAYVARHLADPAFRHWRAVGAERGSDLPWYARDWPTRPWPG